MNILGVFLNNQVRTGGNKRYLALMEELAARGNAVCVIMNSYLDYNPECFKKIVLSVKYQRKGFPPASYLFKKKIKDELDIIRNNFSADFILIFGDTHLKSAIFLKNALRLPLFYAFRANDIDRAHIMRNHGGLSLKEYISSFVYERINRFREKLVARKADIITFQNGKDRDCFLRRTKCDASKTIVIPGNIGSWCTPEWHNRNTSVKVEKLLYVGLLSVTKGLWELLKALRLLKERGYDFLRCYILGRLENTQPVTRLVKDLDIEEMVSFEGFEQPFPYLAECDLMVFPTLYDAFPNTVLEALHVGCPVIASSVGGVPDLLRYSELLFEPGNVREIADKIEACVKNPSLYLSMRKLCAERAAAHRFDWAEQFEIAMKDYNSLSLK